MEIHFLFWLIFAALLLSSLFLILFIQVITKEKLILKAALMWSVIWIAAGFAFAILIYFYFPDGHTKSFEYIASYLIEKSLSVDNLFVFLMIFGTMGIPNKHQPRILKSDYIKGAVVLRIIFILAGVQLLKTFSFMIYIFGAVLVYTAVKMFTAKDQKIHPNDNVFVKITKKFFRKN